MNRIGRLASFLACLAALAPISVQTAGATPFDETLFTHKSIITVSGYAGGSILNDFPVLVTLAADAPAGFRYTDCAADGSDIRFVDANGELVPHEIEKWNAQGTSYIWVKVPRLSGTATQFVLFYGADDDALALSEMSLAGSSPLIIIVR